MGTVKVTQENLDSLVGAINNREKTTEVDIKLATKLGSTENAASATKLATARTFAITGAVTGTISSDLLSGASIVSSLAATTDLGSIADAVS